MFITEVEDARACASPGSIFSELFSLADESEGGAGAIRWRLCAGDGEDGVGVGVGDGGLSLPFLE